MTAIFCFSFNT